MHKILNSRKLFYWLRVVYFLGFFILLQVLKNELQGLCIIVMVVLFCFFNKWDDYLDKLEGFDWKEIRKRRRDSDLR